ncbi:hypothetical protein TorRG33x02_196300 [Trema orientale]|uniref:DNA2/NAM7 helicase helicase domain-containing protein n=1 Tax=Trema orientale TaxID=63057 RepID=A0A2P5EG91_TREOI|nr:hypothetical protein TorRG33x02_196300 [Trema orientale]
MNCRTLISTPTNVAISDITTRLVKQASVLTRYSKYGLGNLVMLSSRIEEGDYLFDVLLSHRIDVLNRFFDPKTGWRSSLSSLILFLEDPRRVEYYLENSQIHLPTSILSLPLLKCMSKALTWLSRLNRFMRESAKKIEEVFNKYGIDEGGHYADFNATRKKCISLLKLLSSFDIGDMNAEQFALKNATMIFCTVSNTSKLKNAGSFEVLIVDEADN